MHITGCTTHYHQNIPYIHRSTPNHQTPTLLPHSDTTSQYHQSLLRQSHIQPITENALTTLDITDNTTLAQLYHQAWNVITISLLQRARNVQHIIQALIYHQQTKITLTPPPTPTRARIPRPKGPTFAATVLETHRFTTTTTKTTTVTHSPALVEPRSPRRCTHPRCTLAERLHRTAGAAQGNDIYC